MCAPAEPLLTSGTATPRTLSVSTDTGHGRNHSAISIGPLFPLQGMDDGVIGMAPPLHEPLAEVDEGDGDSVEERADTGYGVSSEGGQV